MAKTKSHADGMAVKGFFRVQLTETGKGVVGDSGWCQNQVTDLGIRQYVVDWLTSGAGKSVTYMALGTGGAPASNATSLSGELTHSTSGRAAVSSSIVASGTAQFTGAFASANSFVTATADISNIGLFNTSTTGAGTIFAGNTFASSSCAINQSVNAFLEQLGTFISNGEKKIPQIRWNPLFTETIPSQPCLRQEVCND